MSGIANGKYLWNDAWSFLKTPIGVSYESALIRAEEFVPVDIPHDWLIYDSMHLYEDGIGWYRKKFVWREGEDKKAFVTFEGVYMDSTVYINGKKAGEWKYGYSAFTLDVTDYLVQGENEIVVSACFQNPNSRWYSGAGIYRNVWLKVTEKTYLPEHAVYISAKRQEDGAFLLSLKGEIAGERAKDAVISHTVYDTAGKEVHCELTEDDGYVRKYLVKDVSLWDIDSPVLYTLRTELVLDAKVIQTEEEKFGFRYVQFHPQKGFFLNGRNIKLNGVCEHHDLGALGAAFHKPAMRRKLRILKEMGVNALRCAHNMAAPGVMELADEMGILVISEAFDMWESAKTTYDYARFFTEWSAKDVESWVKQDRNHPCVILWSVGNEIHDTHAGERGQEIIRYLKELVEKYDASQNAAVTIASNYMPWENAQKCADIVKIAGYNYAEKCYGEHHREHPDWVIYGSETSSIVQSRGVYHFPLKAGILSEEDRQCSALGNSSTSWGAKSIEQCAATDRDTPFSMGQFLWSGFDYIGEPTPYHTKNSYFGQIDTAGFPKDSYYVWQSVWTDYKKAPMVYIFPYWDFNEGQLIDVRVCSNAPYVETFINGKSLGKQHLTHEAGSGCHILADYQIPYEDGVLAAVAYDENGTVVARAERKSFGNSARIVLTAENTEVMADGSDLLFVQIATVDSAGNPVENACDRITVRVSGAGRLIGLDNGDSTDMDSYKGISRRLFSGKLLAIIQADEKCGEIRVEAAGKGLQGAVLVCKTKETGITDSGDVRTNVIHKTEENKQMPVQLGSDGEIPVRRIVMKSLDGFVFTKEKGTITAEVKIEPPQADDRELYFKAANDIGVPLQIVDLALVRHTEEGAFVTMKAKGDGAFRLFAMSKSGTDNVRIMSQLSFSIMGLGQIYKNPYDFISASLYDDCQGEVGNGNERGVATGRDGETVLTYRNIDFGEVGSDEIIVPVFALNDDEYPIEIWEGVPGEAGCKLLANVIYQKPSIWNVYQPFTHRFAEKLRGITSLSFHFYDKLHMKGFSFTKYDKAWQELMAGAADAVYGDSFTKTPAAVEQIGNNVSLVFLGMNFGDRALRGIAIEGRAGKGANTIQIRFSNGEDEIIQMVEFPAGDAYTLQEFSLEPVSGEWEVDFVFLPGSCFDFASFRFF